MGYTTVIELRSEMNKTDTGDDATLTRLIDAATENIDRYCNRIQDGFVGDTLATARLYKGSGTGWQRIDECVAVTLVRVKPSSTSAYEAWTATDYIECTGDERNPNYNQMPYTALRVDPNGDFSIFYLDSTYPTVEITARWGYAEAVPYGIKTATIMQSARWYKRLQGAMSDSLASVEAGIMMYTKTLDPDIQRLLVDGRFVRRFV